MGSVSKLIPGGGSAESLALPGVGGGDSKGGGGKNLKDPLGLGLDPERDIKAFTGQTGAEAALKGTELQVEAGREALALLREDLGPFRDLGVRQIESVESLASDPAAQAAFLEGNPLFESLAERAKSDIFTNRAARGKLGSGGTALELQNRLIEQGNQLIDRQLNRQLPLLTAGQASAAQQGIQGGEILTDIGTAASAGGIAAANAQQQGAQNVGTAALGTLALLFSDDRLKEDVVVEGEKNGLDVVSWKWNETANKIGLVGCGRGHLSSQVKKVMPHLVESINGFMLVNYGTNETTEPMLWH